MKLTQYILVLFFILPNSGCKVNYSFTGASIQPDVKTINVKFFNKTATLGPATLSQEFTEKLRERFITQTSLSLVNGIADLTLEGTISSYIISPQAIQANETAARNRLTIMVNVKFTNLKDEKQNFEATFSRFSEYQSTLNIIQVEGALIDDIIVQLIDDIFNRAVINW